MTKASRMTFLDLAVAVMDESDEALSVGEIWTRAKEAGLTQQLGSSGKTPVATLGAQLYTSVKKPDSLFIKLGARPAKFMLATAAAGIGDAGLAVAAQRMPVVAQTGGFKERELHQLLVWFADRQFGAACRTVFHERSQKRGAKQDEWIHPDIVGFSLLALDWDQSVVELARASRAPLTRLYSFELKKRLDFPSLRSSFFQAVSNSSWANEGFLVAVEIDEDPDFWDELGRLSMSFGIGVIQLDISAPEASRVALPARGRDEIDWETATRIATLNPNFHEFIDSTAKSARINQLAIPDFDPVPSDDELAKHLSGLSKSARL